MARQIVEIIGRSIQGITNPFYCRCEDGQTYFVKGAGAGKRDLISEYVAGRLARTLGLPVPEFEIVEIPAELIKWCDRKDANDLGVGLAFGSRELLHAQEFSFSHIPLVDVQIRKDVAVFDWWVHNGDRTLTAKGGNPNLLWDQDHAGLAVIDHNQAFDAEFDAQRFLELHVFHDSFLDVLNDMVERENYRGRLSAAFAEFDLACDNVPSEWWVVGNGVPTNFDRIMVRNFLERFVTNNFWGMA